MTIHPSKEKPLPTTFWSQHMRSVISPLMQATGSYTPAAQASNLGFLDEHIAPTLGPLPTDPHPNWVAPCAVVGTPFNPSFNLSAAGKPAVRFDYDLLPPLRCSAPASSDGGEDEKEGDPWGEDAARTVLRRLATVLAADTQWLEYFMDRLFLSPDETQALLRKVPAEVVIPSAMVGVQFDGAQPRLKAWVPTMRKALVQGRSSNEVGLEALRGMRPLGREIAPAVDVLEAWLTTTTVDARLMLVGMDCGAPHASRLKIYIVTSANSWATVRDVMTMGGRLDDDAAETRIALLRTIWPYLVNDVDGVDDEHWCKPERMPRLGFSGLMYSIDIKPGRPLPEPKVYVPLFQYAESSAVAEQNMETVLKMLDIEWGRSGRYRRAMEMTFGKGKEYGQIFAAFSYSERTGAYVNSYVSMPIEDVPVHPLLGEYV